MLDPDEDSNIIGAPSSTGEVASFDQSSCKISTDDSFDERTGD